MLIIDTCFPQLYFSNLPVYFDLLCKETPSFSPSFHLDFLVFLSISFISFIPDFSFYSFFPFPFCLTFSFLSSFLPLSHSFFPSLVPPSFFSSNFLLLFIPLLFYSRFLCLSVYSSFLPFLFCLTFSFHPPPPLSSSLPL